MADSQSGPAGLDPTPEESLFRLDLGENGSVLAPANVSDLLQWINVEMNFWSWINTDGVWREPFTEAFGSLNSARRLTTTALESTSNTVEQTRAVLDGVQKKLAEVYVQRRLPHSTSLAGLRIASLATREGTQTAAGYLAAMMSGPQHSCQGVRIDFLAGVAQAVADASWGRGSTPDPELERLAHDAFQKLRAATQSTLTAAAEESRRLQLEADSIRTALQQRNQSQLGDFNIAQVAREEEFRDLMLEHRKELDAQRQSFVEEMGLRAPASYWTEKSKSHSNGAWRLGLLTFGVLVGIIWVLLGAPDLIDPRRGQDGKPDPWALGVLVLVGVFAVWVVRLLVRMFLSQLHLAQDAAERVTMATTYLSLHEGKQLEGAEDRKIILQALFRPSSDGIVKDEGLPPSFAEVFTRGPK